MSRVTSYRLKRSIALAAVLIAACVPATVQPQEFAFLVVRSAKDAYAYNIWAADCGKVNLTTSDQKVACTLSRRECKPEECPFSRKSDDAAPLPLIFGISTYNPTCGQMWDPYRKVWIYKPC